LIVPLQSSAIALAAAGCVLAGWAVPEPDSQAVWLQRNGWAYVALTLSVVSCLAAVPRSVSLADWANTARRAGAWLAVASFGLLLIVLVQQVVVFDPVARRTPLGLAEVLAVLAGIATLMILAVRAGFDPEADPFAFDEAHRSRHIYLAELLLVLLFVHVRLNLPELVPPQAGRFWTLIVMFFAFVGIGSAELAERKRQLVLVRPLRQTGVLLPIIPLLAFWAKPPGVLLEWADGRGPGDPPVSRLPRETAAALRQLRNAVVPRRLPLRSRGLGAAVVWLGVDRRAGRERRTVGVAGAQ